MTETLVRTRDGAGLRVLRRGTGPAVVMLHGWSASALQFFPLLEELSSDFTCLAVDQRGHGDSEKPATGYCIAQLAADLQDVLESLEFPEVTLLGHSMGCSVIWAYWQRYGARRLRNLVLVDQSPCLTADPGWTERERRIAGAVLDPAGLARMLAWLRAPDGARFHARSLRGAIPESMDPSFRQQLLERFLKLPTASAADLSEDHFAQDWRTVIPTITVPTLIFGGRRSIVPWESQQWVHQRIAGSRLSIFEENQGGGHFLFLENAPRFVRDLRGFLG